MKIEGRPVWINYHHLYYFHVAATVGGVAKAAEHLRIGQPTLSIQLKQLEETLGEKLFERVGRRLQLTEAGKMTLQYTQEIFRLGHELFASIHDKVSKERVQLQVGALDSVPKHIIVDLIGRAYKIKDCSIVVLEGRGDELLRELRSYAIDLIVSNYAPTVLNASGVFSKNILRSEVIVAAAPKYAHLKKNFPKSLVGQPMVMPTVHSQLRLDLEHYFRLNQISVDTVAETQDTSIQLLLGERGVGLIPVSEEGIRDQLKNKKLVNLGRLHNVYEQIWLIANQRKIENPVAAELFKSYEGLK